MASDKLLQRDSCRTTGSHNATWWLITPFTVAMITLKASQLTICQQPSVCSWARKAHRACRHNRYILIFGSLRNITYLNHQCSFLSKLSCTFVNSTVAIQNFCRCAIEVLHFKDVLQPMTWNMTIFKHTSRHHHHLVAGR